MSAPHSSRQIVSPFHGNGEAIQTFDLTRFLHANRMPLRSKTLYPSHSGPVRATMRHLRTPIKPAGAYFAVAPNRMTYKRAMNEPMDTRNNTDNKQSRPTLEALILELCAARGPDRTICPTEAARAFAAERGEEGEAWRKRLPQVRAAAIGLARKGSLTIYRKGKPVDPDDFRGVYRLGLPRAD